jgi:diguanylate cyclase (GGDEF)-like protein/PAS domain S-box-containing protein
MGRFTHRENSQVLLGTAELLPTVEMTRRTMTVGGSGGPGSALQRFRWFLALGTAWTLAQLWLPAVPHGVVYLVGAAVVIGICWRRTRWFPESVRRPVRLVVLAGAASLVGVLLRSLYGMAVGRDFPFPSPGDAVALLAYPLVLAAILLVVRRRLGRYDSDLAVDAVVAGLSAAVVQWSLVILPFVQDTSFSLSARLLQVVYAALGILVFMAAVMTLVAGGHRSTSNRLLAGALVTTFVVDNFGTFLTANHADEGLLLSVAPLIYLLGGAGILHPSITLLTSRPNDLTTQRRLTATRTTVMAAALAAPPALVVWFSVTGAADRLLLPAVGTLTLVPLVILRMARLVRDRERFAGQEAGLRAVGEHLVGAETTDDVARVITVGAEQVLGARFADGGLLLDPLDDTVWDQCPSCASAVLALRTHLAAYRHPTTGQVVDLDVAGDRSWTAGLVVVGEQVRAALVLSCTGPADDTAREAVAALCREAAIGLRAVEQTEQQVRRRSEERFAALVDNSSDIVAVVDDAETLHYVSPVAFRLLGYPERTLLQSTFADLVHPADRESAARMLHEVRSGRPEATELRLRHVAGTYHWFEVVGVDLRTDPNIGGVVLNAREVGDRKQAEERLVLSEARFKALVQYSTDLVVVVDSHDRVRYASPSVSEVQGEAPEELLERLAEDVFRESGVDWHTALRTAVSDDVEPGTARMLEFGFRNAAGEWRNIETTVTDLRNERSVGGFVLNARDVTERKKMEQRLRFQATHDELTGLANRTLVLDELDGILSRNQGATTVAAIFLDLDDFKDVNDSLGHAVGDQLLVMMADRIRSMLTFGDMAARIGGDEFLVVLERGHGERDITDLCEQLLTAIASPYEIDGRQLSVSASAGIAFDHDRSATGEILLRNADTAMYRSKRGGKHTTTVFEPYMHTASFDRLELRADLSVALDDDQFVAHYQPIVDLATGRITGTEALVRWNHPRRGLLGPNVFIPLAEETGQIGRLGLWVLERACTDMSVWRAELGPAVEHLTMSVNLSVQQLHDDGLVPAVFDTLERTGVPADRLVLEITESTLITDTDKIRDRMEQLRSLGLRLAIDDFGTGYSSLGYIQQFAFDVLKIDRTFVDGLERFTNQRIVTAVIELAKELGVRTVAEGIEQELHADLLRDLGCTLGQGYLYSRPVPAPEFAELLVGPLGAPVTA